MAVEAFPDHLLIRSRGVQYGELADLVVPLYEAVKTLPADEVANRLIRVAVLASAALSDEATEP